MSELIKWQDKDLTEYYEAESVDAILAEKDAKILALDAEVFKQKHNAKLFFDERNYAEAQLRRQKYKRCLAMALLWLERAENSTDLENELVSRRRCSKWMELAEKFKEAK